MSNHLDPFSNRLKIQTIQEIDNLDLPVMQKHHLRILAHCLEVLKIKKIDNNSKLFEKNLLREWCDNQSKRFDDEKFSDLFYRQIESAAKKKREAITTIISTVIVLVRVSLLVAQVIRDISPLTCLTNLAGLVLAISRNLFLL